MKTITAILCLMALLSSCKKDTTTHTRTITVNVTNIVKTKYNITITNYTQGGGLILGVDGATANNSYTTSANPGDYLTVKYNFVTQGQQYGKGDLDILSGATNIYQTNGGVSEGVNVKVP